MLWLAGLFAFLAVGLLSSLRFIPLEAREDTTSPDPTGHDPTGPEPTGPKPPNIRLVSDNPAPVTSETPAQAASSQDWFSTSSSMSDFDPTREELVVVWDDRTGERPGLSLAPNAANLDLIDVFADETRLVQLPRGDGQVVQSVHAIPYSVARARGWASA